MAKTAVRQLLQRALALLGVPLVAAGATVVLTAAPAHAALVYQGTFTLRTSTGTTSEKCLQVQNNGRTSGTPIVEGICNGGAAQRWAIFLATDRNDYWILAYGGEQPLNMCLDKGDSDHIWIRACFGGSEQRWDLRPNTTDPQMIRSLWNTSECIATHTGDGTKIGLFPCFVDFQAAATRFGLIPA